MRLFIRGVGQNDVQVTQDPSVALYMDGVYIGSSAGTAFETADLERIEVLRGPRGTLYGRNATGGAINIITRNADPGGLAIKQSFNVGNLDAGERDYVNISDADITGAELDLTAAITDELTGTFSYGYLDTGFGPETITYLALDPTSPLTDTLTEDLALAAKQRATIALDYNLPMSFGTISANINAQYQERTNTGVSLPTGYMDDRTLLGANLALSEIRLGANYGQLKVTLWGKNLLDQEYYTRGLRAHKIGWVV